MEDDTDDVLTVAVALVAPAATVTDAGTDAAALLLASATVAPPDGAAPDSVTVKVADAPPVTEAGEIDSDFRVTGAGVLVTVSVANLLMVGSAALSCALVSTAAVKVVIVKEAIVAPAATITDEGTVTAEVLPLFSDTL